MALEPEAAADEAAELAAEAAEVASEEGTATEIPAALQMPARAETASVGWLVWLRREGEQKTYWQSRQPSSGWGCRTEASW